MPLKSFSCTSVRFLKFTNLGTYCLLFTQRARILIIRTNGIAHLTYFRTFAFVFHELHSVITDWIHLNVSQKIIYIFTKKQPDVWFGECDGIMVNVFNE